MLSKLLTWLLRAEEGAIMNEWCIYIALYCVLLYTQSSLQSCGGGGEGFSVCSIHLDDATAATGQRLPVHSPHTSYTGRGERVIESIKCMRSPHTSYRWRGERDRANQVYALTTHQLQVERRESHRANQVYALTTHQLQVERRER